jgi:hypothetical protein
MSVIPLKVLVDLQARKNASVSGSLEVTGSTKMVGAVVAQNGVAVTGELSGSAALKAGGDLTVAGVSALAGKVTANAGLDVIGQISGSGDLKAGGNAAVAGTTALAGKLTANAGADVIGQISGSGDLKAGGVLAVAGTSALAGKLTANAGADVIGVLSASSDLKAGGALDVAGASTLAGAVVAQAGLTVTGDISGSAALKAGGNLEVAGTSTLASKLTANAGADVIGVLSASSDLKAGGALAVAGVSTLAGKLSANAGVDVIGVMSASSDLKAGGKLEVAGTSTLAGKLTANAGVDVIGQLSASAALKVGAAADVAGKLTVKGDTEVEKLIVNGDMFIKGTSTTVNVETTNVSIKDPIIHLGSGSDTGVFANGDRGFVFDYAADDKKGMWFDFQTSKFILGDNVTVVENDGNVSLAANGYGELLAGGLEVSGSAKISSGLTVDSGGAAIVGDSTITGYLSASGDLYGNSLDVVGAVEAATLTLDGGTLSAASAAATVASLSASGEVAALTVKVEGAKALESFSGLVADGVTYAGNKLVNGDAAVVALGQDGAGKSAIVVSGSDLVQMKSAKVELLAGAAKIDVLNSGIAIEGAQVTLASSANLKVSGSLILANTGSAFTKITALNGAFYNVDEAVHAIDSALIAGADASSANYKQLRLVKTGSLASGAVSLGLISDCAANATKFASAQIDNLTLDVMVRPDNTSAWMNDLVSVYLYKAAGTNAITVDISAPAASNGWEYKLVVVNENGNLF